MASIKSRKRITEILFLEDLLIKNPDWSKKIAQITLARNVGWSFQKTNEILKVIVGTNVELQNHKVFKFEY